MVCVGCGIERSLVLLSVFFWELTMRISVKVSKHYVNEVYIMQLSCCRKWQILYELFLVKLFHLCFDKWRHSLYFCISCCDCVNFVWHFFYLIDHCQFCFNDHSHVYVLNMWYQKDEYYEKSVRDYTYFDRLYVTSFMLAPFHFKSAHQS